MLPDRVSNPGLLYVIIRLYIYSLSTDILRKFFASRLIRTAYKNT